EPTVHAVELITRYISMQYRREVLTADLGASNTTVSAAGGADGNTHSTAVRGDFGLAQGLSTLLAEAGAGAILRWLPFECSAGELQDWALNRVLRPWTLPQTARDLAIEHAFAREALRITAADLRAGRAPAPTYDLLIGTGGLLAHAPRVGQAALVLLDGLQPTGEGVGSLEIALDSTLMMPALGALAPVHPSAAAYLFDRDCLVLLGTCVVPLDTAPVEAVVGNGRTTPAPVLAGGKAPIAVEVTVEYADAGYLTIEVPYGKIEIIPLRPEQRASLRVKPGAAFRIGTDEPGKQVQTKPGEEIKGGLIGLIIDARGRPLVLPEDDATRIATLLEWGQALRAYSAQETFSRFPETVAPPAREPLRVAADDPANAGAFQSNFGATGRISTGMLDTLTGGDLPAEPAPPVGPPAWASSDWGATPDTPLATTGPLAPFAPRRGTDPLQPPAGMRTGSLDEGEPLPPAPLVGGLDAPRRTGKLNLPSVGESGQRRGGTAPLQWPTKEE
ncbi:MAG TPA: glutamate mutase L, partial [Chloroflexia bacterium]|nr:glutamate mutase L [Chloroflexia bacterium]